MLREAFQPFELFVAQPTRQDNSSQIHAGEDWQDTPLFCGLRLSDHRIWRVTWNSPKRTGR